MMRFPPEFIERVRANTLVSEVVGRRVALRRNGREFGGLCPFHKEKTPSFTVNDEKGFYHCFGCGAHGDAIRFLTEAEGMRYPEAIEKLAADAGLPLPQMTPVEQAKAKRVASQQEVMEEAARWYETQLFGDKGGVARRYLRERGLSRSVCQHFRLGFAPDDRDALKKHLAAEGVSEQTMIDLGLIIKPDQGNSYDRFRARLMFPITDRRNQVIAFGGRILPELVAQSNLRREPPKYLNSPDTPLFHKGEVLYGYASARTPAHKAGTVLVTEGYMDVIALYQAGFANAVAPLGTAVTEGHLRLLWQLADDPIMCLDGDAAGQRAMHRAAELSLGLLKPGKSLRFLLLPEGEDPDTLVRSRGAEVFRDLQEQAMPLSDALWQTEAGSIAQLSPEKRAAVEHRLMQLTEKMTDPTVRSHFRNFFRQRLWPERTRGKGGKGGKAETLATRSRDVEAFMKKGEKETHRRQEFDMLALLIHFPDMLDDGEVEEGLGRFAFTDSAYDRLRHAILTLRMDQQSITQDALQRELEGDAASLRTLTRLLEQAPTQDAQKARQKWQLLAAEHDLLAMRAECRQLEVAIAEEVDEASYRRLEELTKAMTDLQTQTRRIQESANASGW